MWIKDLRVYQFRNLVDSTVTFQPGVNLIIGQNGHGKTNCLEGISVISSSKSFRTSKLSELIKWNKEEASIFSNVTFGDGLNRNIGLTFGKKTKQAYIDDSLVKSADDFIGLLACVTFTPDDLNLVKGGPAERRRFMDRALAFLDRRLIRTLTAYNTVVRSKNSLLKNIAGKPKTVILDELDSWNRLIAKYGSEIELSRRDFIEKISIKAANIYKSYSPEGEALEISLKSSRTKPTPSEYLLMEELSQAKERELIRQQSLVGPHRDDILILLSGIDANSFASQGQTRSIVLALKLALIEQIEESRGDAPIILLDDVDSELDQKRRESFFRCIVNNKRQVIISGTNAKVLPISSSEINLLRMENGLVSGN